MGRARYSFPGGSGVDFWLRCQTRRTVTVGALSASPGWKPATEQLAAGVVERSKADLVNQNQLVAQQVADDNTDGVVRQTPVQRFDQVRDDDVADLHLALHCADAAANQGVTFACSAGPHLKWMQRMDPCCGSRGSDDRVGA